MVSFPFIAGFIAAGTHVLSGPDHLAAVTPLVTDNPEKSWRIGLFWGIGHILGMILIGVLFLLFKAYIPLDFISGISERLVGIILIALGFWTFYRIFRQAKRHAHPHMHRTEQKVYVHIHRHEHTVDSTHAHSHFSFIFQTLWSALGIGIIHGFAGISHFILLFPVLGFNHISQSIFYMGGFALGTVTTMIFYAFLVGKLSVIGSTGEGKMLGILRWSSGLFALLIGIYWILKSL